MSIRLRADGLSFYGHDASAATPMVIENYPCPSDGSLATAVEEALAQSPLLRGGLKATVYCLASGPSMQIPLEHFHKEEVHTFYRLTHASDKPGKTYYNILPHLEIAEIFTVDSDAERILCQHFPGIRFYHSHSMILEKVWMLSPQDKQPFYVYFDQQEVFAFCYKQQRLHYANTFPADTVENVAYFLLSAWKGLELNAQENPCILIGQNELKEETAQLLSRFLKNVRNAEATDLFRRSALARNPQVPFDLLALLAHVI